MKQIAPTLALLFFWVISAQAQSVPEGLSRLQAAYPDHIARVTPNALIWTDGETTPYDDGRVKDFAAKLADPDLEDQMSIPYPSGTTYPWPPPENFDPGRIRFEPFFKKMYGSNPADVQTHLRPVDWLPGAGGKKLMATSLNGVDQKLRAVSQELDALGAQIRRYVDNPAGTYYWRTIEGTPRLSVHSFGIAIDINVKYSRYWRWDLFGPQAKLIFKNDIPLDVVRVFEKHGFIWGGKWYHYDTMHFEYRPELLPPPAR